MKPTMLSRAQAYLAYRRALGFKLKSEGIRLLSFARYADASGHSGSLTTKLAIRWACLPQKADRLYWARRLEVVRRFAKHLLLTDADTQVPPRHLFGPAYRRNPPHLYSSKEIGQVLHGAGQLKGGLRPHTFQSLVGLLACTGMRISEALKLKQVMWTWSGWSWLFGKAKGANTDWCHCTQQRFDPYGLTRIVGKSSFHSWSTFLFRITGLV
jgi:site-specific recombinase XerD